MYVGPVATRHGVVQNEELLNHSNVTLEGDGSQPLIEADSVFPTTAVPVIVGAGREAKGSPETTVAVETDSVVVRAKPGLDAETRTIKVCPRSLEVMVYLAPVPTREGNPLLNHSYVTAVGLGFQPTSEAVKV